MTVNRHRLQRLEHAARMRQVSRAADPDPKLKLIGKLSQMAERIEANGGVLTRPEDASPATRLAFAALTAGPPGSAAFCREAMRLLGEYVEGLRQEAGRLDDCLRHGDEEVGAVTA